MLQDIEPRHLYNEFKQKNDIKPKAEDYVLIYTDNQAALTKAERYTETKDAGLEQLPTCAYVEQYCPEAAERLTYLFAVDEMSFFLLTDTSGITEENFSFVPLRFFRTMQPSWAAFAGITGSQLFRWYESRRYCGRCGERMSESVTERAMVCPACGLTEYPKISPAVIVGVMDGDKILMTKYANRTFKKYALIAGFTEFGETLEGTVHREVMEEVGMKVKNIRYFANQPWAFSDSLLVGFFADLDGDRTITLDREELAEAQWFTRAEMPMEESNHLSLTNAMMCAFKEGKI